MPYTCCPSFDGCTGEKKRFTGGENDERNTTMRNDCPAADRNALEVDRPSVFYRAVVLGRGLGHRTNYDAPDKNRSAVWRRWERGRSRNIPGPRAPRHWPSGIVPRFYRRDGLCITITTESLLPPSDPREHCVGVGHRPGRRLPAGPGHRFKGPSLNCE